MDYDESSDILGGRLHVSPQSSSVWFHSSRITLLLGLGLVALYAWVRMAPQCRQWRETRYRKGMRRRHGIPDVDNRPFNVAYAAALQARKRRDAKGRAVQEEPIFSLDDERIAQTASQPSLQAAENATGHGGSYLSNNHEIGPSDVAGLSRPDAVHAASQHDRVPQIAPTLLPNGSSRRKARQSGIKQPLVTRSLHGKHALDDGMGSESETLAKKSRVEGVELIDGDEEAEWHGTNEKMDIDEPVWRGSKRVASSEDNDSLALSRASRHEKRARKISIDRSQQSPDQDMQEMEEEELEEDTEGAVRGKKRDRAEAGSTFGGDDSLNDDEDKPHRRRRRRTVLNKLGQNISRGQKRGRDPNSPDSDGSESERPRRTSMRKKRGRRAQDEVVSVSNDPLCNGRRIGEEWECNGIRYKVGPNGQRLRQELVKKSKTRFSMPSDSYHPDRRAHVDVYVETWLSEEEYLAAKEHCELAWQNGPSTSEPQTPGDVPDSPSKAGKNLLWSSTMSSRESPIKRGPFRQSIATNVGLRLSVFPPQPVSSTRRIASVYQVPASPAADSPKIQKTKSYSKWEKQDLEAAAMSKLRDRQQAARAAETKTLPTSTSAAALFTGPSNVAGLSSNAPSAPASTTFNFAAPASADPTPAKPETTSAASTASTEASQHPAAPFFVTPSAGTPSTTASAAAPKPGAPVSHPTTQSTPSVSNLFAKPPNQTAALPTQAPNSSAPKPGASTPTFSFVAPPAQQAAPSNPAPSGATSNEAPKAATGASLMSRLGMGPPPAAQSSAAPMFSFAKPTAPAAGTPAAGPSDATKAVSTTPASGASAAPKFDFGLSSKPTPATSTPVHVNGTSAPTAASSVVSSTPATSTPKFSFGMNNNSNTQPVVTGVNANATAAPSFAPKPTFSFGPSATPAATSSGAPSGTFGAPSNTPTATTSHFGGASNTAGNAAQAPKSAFSFGGNTSTQSATNASPFAAKPAEAPSSAFSFGGSNASPAATPSRFGNNTQSTTVTKTDAPKPTLSFGTPSSSAPAFGAPSTPAFGASSSTPTFGAPSASGFATPSIPAFGAPSAVSSTVSKPATFSFGAPTSNTAASAILPTPTSATENKSSFSFNFGAATANNTPNSTASNTFGTPASNPQAQPGSNNAFNFAAPSGAFSFGANSGQNTQK